MGATPPLRAALVAVLLALPAAAQQAPLSAIDWLSESLDAPAPEAPVSGGGIVAEPVTVAPLAASGRDGLGVLTSARSGLPRTLWGTASRDDVIARIERFPKDTLPAVRDVFRRILLARVDAPRGGGTRPPGALLTARIDAALDRGDLETADRLIAVAGAARPDLFRRAFDVALLTGREDAACAKLQQMPGIAPSYPVRIFCLARTGDWRAAAITLRTAQALGALAPGEQALLDRFLELEAFDDAPALPRPRLPSPLQMRLHEAIGEPIPTNTLPIAFAHADLRRTAGWKARIAAAERLVHAGVLPAQRLAEIYGERAPAASGDPWDRVAAMQRLMAAIETGRADAASATLPDAAAEMRAAGLTGALADIAVPGLQPLAPSLSPQAAALAWRLALRGPDYERVAAAPPEGLRAPLLQAVAAGRAPATAPTGLLARAIADAFAEIPPPLPETWEARLADGPLGVVLLDALALLPARAGDGGDAENIMRALVVLRRVGLEDTARRAALELLLQQAPA